MRFLVLGAGLQGTACTYDLLNAPGVTQVFLADLREPVLPPFLKDLADERLVPIVLDVRDEAAVRGAFSRCDGVLSAIPYYLNGDLARLAVESGVHWADLGGNTAIVQEQKKLDGQAQSKQISVVPDTGLAPGMVNVIAQHGIDQFDTVNSVQLLVGGLPQIPEPPLGYQIAYSIEGMVDYYTTPSLVMRDGKLSTVDALSELESVRFQEPVGELEAFHTAGGLSTMVYRYAGKIQRMEYKTLRYPGHAAIMRSIRDLGLLGTEAVNVKGQQVIPRDVFAKVAGDVLRKNKPDLVALRVIVAGTKNGVSSTRSWEVVDLYDQTHGITAMERTTGYTLAITGLLQQSGAIPSGVHTPDECFQPERYFSMLKKRGIEVKEL